MTENAMLRGSVSSIEVCYDLWMTKNKELRPEEEAYIRLLTNMYERMEKENSWPWVTDPEGWEKTHGKLPEDEQGHAAEDNS
jgi:hypothetical protein